MPDLISYREVLAGLVRGEQGGLCVGRGEVGEALHSVGGQCCGEGGGAGSLCFLGAGGG